MTRAFALILLCGCAGLHPAQAARPAHADVQVFGALRAMMHEGQTGAVVQLDSLLPDPQLYAVGALADLAGEVTIVGGQVHLSYPDDTATRTVTSSRSDAAAALLVAARVPAWRSVRIEASIAFADLDAAIARHAAAAGVPADARVPFLLEGEFEDLQWHVIDGRRLPKGESSHAAHLAASARAQRDRARATLVGFFSTRDQGVFTHMGSNTHIHCVLTDPSAAGHVDHVVVPAGATLRFPTRTDG